MNNKTHPNHRPGSTDERKRVMSEVRLLLAIANEEAPKVQPQRKASLGNAEASAKETEKAKVRQELSALAAKKSLTKEDSAKFISLVARLNR